jgi:DNA-binding NarL/FixJ family response regulator
MATADSDIAAHSALGLEREPAPSRPAGEGVSIVLIERRSLTRQCLSRWLQDGSHDLRVVSVGSPADLLDSSRTLNEPQMIVFSIGAASVKDPAVLGRINLLRRHMGRIPLVLLSDRDDVDEIVEAIEHGVRGYVPTSLEPSEAAAAIQCVVAGGTFVPASALIKFAQDRQHEPPRVPRNPDEDPFESLTPRESEVLARLRQGKPNKIIAHDLGITESTVKVFVRRILIKLHASNRTEVASLVRGRADLDVVDGGTRQPTP